MGGNCCRKLWNICFLEYSTIYVQTHVFKISINKISQWVLLNGTVVKSPLRTLVNGYFMHEGVYNKPL